MVTNLVKIVEDVEKGLREAISNDTLTEYLSDVLGVERKQVLLGNDWETTGYTLTLTFGGPNTYLIVEPSIVKVEVYWGLRRYERVILSGAEAEKVFETLKEIYEET